MHGLPITFDEFAEKVFQVRVRQFERMHKGKTRKRQSKKVSEGAKMIGKWADFLRDPLSKTELFTFLSTKTETHSWPLGKIIHVTKGNAVVSLGTKNQMKNCNHE